MSMHRQVQEWVTSLNDMLDGHDLTFRQWYVDKDADHSLLDWDFSDEATSFGHTCGQVCGWAEAHGLTVEQALDGAMPTLPMGMRYAVSTVAGDKVAELYYVHTSKGVSLDMVMTDDGVVPTAIAFPLDEDGHMRGDNARVSHQPDRFVIRPREEGERSMVCIDVEPLGSEPFGNS